MDAPLSNAWSAPRATTALDAQIDLPGSKSLTNRELVLAALADGPSRLLRPLHSRDAQLMVEGLRALGSMIEPVAGDGAYGSDLIITPGAAGGSISIDVGLAGTAMRFLPFVAALSSATVHFDGDPHARMRPMRETIESLRALGAIVEDEGRDALPFSVQGSGGLIGGSLTIDASRSSQFVSALLLAAPRFERGLTITHSGDRLPSLPHIEMTLEALRHRGVDASAIGDMSWRVEPGPIGARDTRIEPDLSNAAPFLAAALVAGGDVSVRHWPEKTTQVGALLPDLLRGLGADVHVDSSCSVSGGAGALGGRRFRGGAIEMGHAGELSPTIAVLGMICDAPLTITGIGHTRGHETDRLEAIRANLTRMGARCEVTDDAITVYPMERLPSGRAEWEAFADHRIATSGALLGLLWDVEVDDIDATSKTIPEFAELWGAMVR
ncbi:3-phosphoshikimate 1-carboxyvinyltransferase [uncultured Agrococcus sp.]|uniref:3-phosphoshikimate 1-carboxyvinyltransferase n=1 Tax=uncultured Agrococcus sp. TaxID=382258 RepID=UPI0025D5AE3E|nr:3-phosphoshikimate 1-carboxyvinyltransferase [uncultured Agrococcus sp.]